MKLKREDSAANLMMVVKERLGEENFTNILSSLATMADIMARHLFQNNPHEFPPQVRYAIVQTYNYIKILGLAFHNPEKLKDGIDTVHFPSYNPRDDKKAEERFIFVVKEYYKALSENGEI